MPRGTCVWVDCQQREPRPARGRSVGDKNSPRRRKGWRDRPQTQTVRRKPLNGSTIWQSRSGASQPSSCGPKQKVKSTNERHHKHRTSRKKSHGRSIPPIAGALLSHTMFLCFYSDIDYSSTVASTVEHFPPSHWSKNHIYIGSCSIWFVSGIFPSY